MGSRNYRLEDLSDEQFQELCSKICVKLLGEGFVNFTSGKDGGRDGKFQGTAKAFPSETEPYEGKFITQAKHTKHPTASCSDSKFNKILVDTNKEDNMSFSARYTQGEDPSSPTSEGEGTSYHKFLCAFFDLAVLRFYKDIKFYHFVYHDGILEGLDDKRKIALIKMLRKYTEEYNIQYILTVIESDLPYEDNKQFHFSNEEIIKKLTDEGEKGRLFNCPVF